MTGVIDEKPPSTPLQTKQTLIPRIARGIADSGYSVSPSGVRRIAAVNWEWLGIGGGYFWPVKHPWGGFIFSSYVADGVSD